MNHRASLVVCQSFSRNSYLKDGNGQPRDQYAKHRDPKQKTRARSFGHYQEGAHNERQRGDGEGSHDAAPYSEPILIPAQATCMEV